MFNKAKQKKLTAEIVKKIHDYNNNKHSDLVAIGEDILNLAKLINKEIIRIEKITKRSIIIKTSLRYNKLFFSDLGVDNNIIDAEYNNKHNHSPKTEENLTISKNIKKEVESTYKETLKSDEYLQYLKCRYHGLISLYSNANYKQITRSSTSKFDSLPFKKQIEMFSSTTFFDLSEDDIKELCQAVANSYCKQMGIRNLPIMFIHEPNSGSYGTYTRFGNYVYINDCYLDSIKKIKESGKTDSCIQYKLLKTVIHECRHSFQSVNNYKELKTKYVSNATKINAHYLLRIYYPEHLNSEDTRPNYYSRIHEMDAFNDSNKYLLELSKLNISNAKEIEDYAVYSLPKAYKAKNTMILEMIELANNYGLTNELSKCIYENMKILGLTSSKYTEYINGDKINYAKTVESCVNNLNSIKLQFALNREKNYREEFFDTLFNRDKYLEEYASKYNMSKVEYENMLENKFNVSEDSSINDNNNTNVEPTEMN